MKKSRVCTENSDLESVQSESQNKETKNKALCFLKKHSLAFVLLICSCLAFLSGFWTPLVYVSCVIISVFYLFSEPNVVMKGFMYFLFFSGIQVLFMVNLVSTLVSLIVHYVVGVIKKQEKVFALPLSITVAFLLIWGLIHYSVGESGFEHGMMIIAIFIAMYLFFAMHKNINVKDCFEYFSLGLVVSGVLSAISLLFNGFAYSVFVDDGICLRVQLLTYHANYLSMNCLFLIAYEIYQMANKKGNFLKCIATIIIAIVAGLLTRSKAFIVVCVLFALYFVICLILHYKWNSLKVIIPLAVICVILGIVFKDFLIGIIERFFAYNEGMSAINQITTGRSGIWFAYVEQTRSSILKMLFGVGLFSNELVEIGPHNVYIYILSRFGFVGIVVIGTLIYSYFKCSENKLKLSFFNILPILTYFVLSIEEMIFSDRYFIFLVLGLMILIEKPENQVQDSPEKSYVAFDNIVNKKIKHKTNKNIKKL